MLLCSPINPLHVHTHLVALRVRFSRKIRPSVGRPLVSTSIHRVLLHIVLYIALFHSVLSAGGRGTTLGTIIYATVFTFRRDSTVMRHDLFNRGSPDAG